MIRGNHWPVALETVRLRWRPERSIELRKDLHNVIRNIFGLTGIVVSAPIWFIAGMNSMSPPNDSAWRYPRTQRLLFSLGGVITTGWIASRIAQHRFLSKVVLDGGKLHLGSRISFALEGIGVAVGTSGISTMLMAAAVTKFPMWIKFMYQVELEGHYRHLRNKRPPNQSITTMDLVQAHLTSCARLVGVAIKSSIVMAAIGASFVIPLTLPFGSAAGLLTRFLLTRVRL